MTLFTMHESISYKKNYTFIFTSISGMLKHMFILTEKHAAHSFHANHGHAADLLLLGGAHDPPVDEGEQHVGQHEEKKLAIDKFIK